MLRLLRSVGKGGFNHAIKCWHDLVPASRAFEKLHVFCIVIYDVESGKHLALPCLANPAYYVNSHRRRASLNDVDIYRRFKRSKITEISFHPDNLLFKVLH